VQQNIRETPSEESFQCGPSARQHEETIFPELSTCSGQESRLQGWIFQADQDTVARAAANSKISAETKRVVRRQLKSSTFESVLAAMSEKGFDWKKIAGRGGRFSAAELKLALEEWDGNNTWTKDKKAGQIVIELERRFKTLRVVFILSMMQRDTSVELIGVNQRECA
jgi:hypothetical protein